MRKKIVTAMGLGVLLLSACGQQELPVMETKDETVTQTASTTQENLQQPSGPLEERAALEWEQRLDYTTQRQEELAQITVELTEDTEEIQSTAQQLLEAMAQGNVEEAAELILAEDWYSIMLSELLIGQRNYVGVCEEGDWRLTVLCDELGQHCTAAEYPLSDGRRFYLQLSDMGLASYVCAANGQGAFTSEQLLFADGSYVKYEGALSEKGMLTGELKIWMGNTDRNAGKMEEIYNRDAQTTLYEGTFTEEGRAQTETPSHLTKEGNLAYACRKEGKQMYYLTVAAGEENVFTAKHLGMGTIWE